MTDDKCLCLTGIILDLFKSKINYRKSALELLSELVRQKRERRNKGLLVGNAIQRVKEPKTECFVNINKSLQICGRCMPIENIRVIR
jgi:hypothetical protein